MVLPKAMMRDLKVDFVSLVDKGANKQRFAIFKGAGRAGTTVAEALGRAGSVAADDKRPVNKMWDEYCGYLPDGSSFNDVLSARQTQVEIDRSRSMMEDYFGILRNVIKGVTTDPTITNKKAAIAKACREFEKAMQDLFKDLPVEEAAEHFNEGGEGMTVKTQNGQPDPTNVDKGDGNGAGVSSNAQPDAKNRPADAASVAGVTKEKAKTMTKAELEAHIAAEKARIAELEEIAKTGTDQPLETGRDTTATNSADGTTAQNSPAPTTPATTGVNKVDGLEAGAAQPGQGPAQTGRVNELTGDIQKIFDSFAQRLEVSMDGKISAATALLKTDMEKLVAEKVEPVAKAVKTIEKSSGLSNAEVFDFDTESERNRDKVTKSEDAEWAKAIDGRGGFRRAAAR